jgi:UDP-galactopyranose mutase
MFSTNGSAVANKSLRQKGTPLSKQYMHAFAFQQLRSTGEFLHLTRDTLYRDRFQGIPKSGYARIFENLPAHENIIAMLGCDARSRITVARSRVAFDGHPFAGTIVFTRTIDEFFDRIFGVVPCRTIDFVF